MIWLVVAELLFIAYLMFENKRRENLLKKQCDVAFDLYCKQLQKYYNLEYDLDMTKLDLEAMRAERDSLRTKYAASYNCQ